MAREPPQIIVVHKSDSHGCLITILLLIVAWPLAIVYWILRLMAWAVGSTVDLLTGGPFRRRRQ